MSAEPTPPSPQESASHARRLAKAFEDVFGTDERRTSSQRIVLEHIRKCGNYASPIFTPDKIGAFDPLRAAHIDGARTIALIIDRQLSIASAVNEQPKKPTVKKG